MDEKESQTASGVEVEVPAEGAEPKELSVEEQIEALKQERDKWKSFARKHEDHLKEIKPLAEQWKQYEESTKPREQLLEEELNTLKAQIAQKETEALKQNLVVKAGLPSDALDLVSGSTEEEMTASIAKIKALIGEQKAAPAPNPLQGLQGGGVKPNESAIERAFREAFNQ